MNEGTSARIVAVALIVAIAQLGARAAAQSEDLVLTTREHGEWGAAVARLQTGLSAEGSTVHVLVSGRDGARAPCGSYALSLDAAGARAFRIGACDPSNDETEVVLVSRHALFLYDGGIARPIAIAIAATVTHFGRAAGGASLRGGSAIDCALAIRPYVYDLVTGQVVLLAPQRYEVVTRDRSVSATADPPDVGPMARHVGSTTIEFDVVDRVTGEVVLRDRATIECASGVTAPPIVQPIVQPIVRPSVRPSVPPSGPQIVWPIAPPVAASIVRPIAIEAPPDASRVLLYRGRGDPGQPTEIVGLIDVQDLSGTEAGAIQQLREHAAAMGADAVLGVEWQPGRGSTHLSGIAVRFVPSGPQRITNGAW